MLQRIPFAHVARAGADHDAQLHFPVGLDGALGSTTGWLQPTAQSTVLGENGWSSCGMGMFGLCGVVQLASSQWQ